MGMSLPLSSDKEKTVIALVYSIEVDTYVVDSKESGSSSMSSMRLRFFEMVILLPEFRNTVE